MAYPLLLLEILLDRGLETASVAQESGIPAHVLSKPDARITLIQWTRLALYAVRLSGDEGLGLEYGLRLRPSAHGFLGYAAMTAPTLREAIALASKYFRMRLLSYQLTLSEAGDHAILEIAEVHPIPMLRSFFFECLLGGLLQLPGSFIGEHAPEMELRVDWPEPVYFVRYRERLPRTHFSCDANQLRFSRTLLDRRPVLADDSAHRQALSQVEREYASVPRDDGDLVARVRAELALAPSGYPTQAALAERLHMSARNLHRRLDARGTRYQILLDEARLRDACRLLESSALELQAIAVQLGFQNPPGFTRAFKRWAGVTPSDYRMGVRAHGR